MSNSGILHKLDQARFFLSKAKEEAGMCEPPLSMNTRHYLDAFITSARTVSWVMKAEYSNVAGWQSWYDSRNASEEEEIVLKKFTILRNEIEKRAAKPPIPRGILAYEILPAGDGWYEAGPVHIEANKNEDLPPVVRGGKFFWYLELDGEIIFPMCDKYFAYLESLIAECIQLFGILETK